MFCIIGRGDRLKDFSIIDIIMEKKRGKFMENKDNVSKNDDKGLAMEMLREFKEQSKRWFRVFLVMVGVEVLTIAGFIWYLYQYDFTSTIEQTGIYTLTDSQGNVISSDITPEQAIEIMEIINNGNNQNDAQ